MKITIIMSHEYKRGTSEKESLGVEEEGHITHICGIFTLNKIHMNVY
jgi:hypothetical protein